MDFVFTETFYSTYKSLSDRDVVPVDEGIRRLMVDHATGWARLGRIEGEKGSAWILTVVTRDLEASLYWEYEDAERILLLALVVRR
jgi:hypothetical protein